jgi:CRP-like cAMP-binding protein
VIEQGDPADAMYVVAAGEVAVTARDAAGEPRHLASLTAPSYVGEIGLLERIPRTATVRTSAASELWRIDGEEFLAALTAAPPAPAFLETARRRHVGPGRAADVAEPPSGPTTPE